MERSRDRKSYACVSVIEGLVFLLYTGFIHIMSTHVQTTDNYDPIVTTSEGFNPTTFQPCDIQTQKWTDCPFTQYYDTTCPKKQVGASQRRSVTYGTHNVT